MRIARITVVSAYLLMSLIMNGRNNYLSSSPCGYPSPNVRLYETHISVLSIKKIVRYGDKYAFRGELPRSFYYYYCIRLFKYQFSSIMAPIKHHATCNATSLCLCLSLSLLRALICRVHERNDRTVFANEQRREHTFVADHLLMAGQR